MNTLREEIVQWKILALTWLQTFLRWGQQTRSGEPALVTWPDLTLHFFLSVCNEKLGKVTKYELNIMRRLAMAQEKPEGGLKAPPRPQ